MSLNIKDSKFYEEYKKAIYSNLKLSNNTKNLKIDDSKLDKLLLKNFTNSKVIIHNNVSNSREEKDILSLTEDLLYGKEKKIFTAHNTIFHNHHEKENIPSGFLDWLKANRSKAKKQMLNHINDVDKTIYNSLNAEQLIMKLFANSYYGAFGMKSFHFFNPFLGPSVTAQGRQLISSSILAFEGFLGDNIKLESFTELVEFIQNIHKEYVDVDLILDTPVEITTTLVRERLLDLCDFRLNDVELEWLDGFVSELDKSSLMKFYYKNNFFEFFKIEEIKEYIKNNFDISNFPDVNEPPEEIVEDLEVLNDYVRYFVSYPYPYPNKTRRASELMRNVVLVCDTDSNFLYVYKWLQYMCELVSKTTKKLDTMERVSYVSVVNYLLTKFVNEVFGYLCGNSNVPVEEHHRINMKSEFHLRRTLITKNKKSYASLVLSKEGKVYNKPVFDIKGIPIKKTTTPKPARIFFSELLEKEILMSENVNIKSIYRQYNQFSKAVEDTLHDSKIGFLKNGVIKVMSAYKEPLKLQTVQAVLVWNALYSKEYSYIGESSSFKILEMNPSLIPPVLIRNGEKDSNGKFIMVDNPEFPVWFESTFGMERYTYIERLYHEQPLLKHYGFNVIALPLDIPKIPEDLQPLMDTGNIVNAVMKKGNILLESLGFVLVESRRRAIISNILKV